MPPYLAPVPPDSIIFQRLHGADFYDCHAMAIPATEQSALALYLQVVPVRPAGSMP